MFNFQEEHGEIKNCDSSKSLVREQARKKIEKQCILWEIFKTRRNHFKTVIANSKSLPEMLVQMT